MAEDVTGAVGSPRRLLQELLDREQRRGTLEYVFAAVLSVATLASAWCGYQLQRWGGLQGDARTALEDAQREAAEMTIQGLQLRTHDGIVLLEYWRLMRSADERAATGLRAHMRPALQAALDASVADGVLKDPARRGPMERPEYVLEVETKARQLRESSDLLREQARQASDIGGRYVVVTLMLGVVLFFGGIAGSFTRPRVRTVMAVCSIALTLVTLILLGRLSITTG